MINQYFVASEVSAPPELTLTDQMIDVLVSPDMPFRLQPLARALGAGTLLATPRQLHEDVVNLFGPAVNNVTVAALMGLTPSITKAPSFWANESFETGLSLGLGIAAFAGTFFLPVIPLAIGLISTRALFPTFKKKGNERKRARLSQALMLVVLYVAHADNTLTVEELRLVKDMARHLNESSNWMRHILSELKQSEDPATEALRVLSKLELSAEDWKPLLFFAVATAHADADYSGDEKLKIRRLRELSGLSLPEFEELIAKYELDYLQTLSLGQATLRGAFSIAAAAKTGWKSSAFLLDMVLIATIPSESQRQEFAKQARDKRLTPMPRVEFLKDMSAELGIINHATNKKADSDRLNALVMSLSLFTAVLEHETGGRSAECRLRLLELGTEYGVESSKVKTWLHDAHKRIENLENDWVPVKEWDSTPSDSAGFQSLGHKDWYEVTKNGDRFEFLREGETCSWRSDSVDFDVFCANELKHDAKAIIVDCPQSVFDNLNAILRAEGSRKILTKI